MLLGKNIDSFCLNCCLLFTFSKDMAAGLLLRIGTIEKRNKQE